MTPNIEQQARRILVAQYVHDGWDEDSANSIAHSADEEITIRAIVRALTVADNYKHAMHAKQAKIDSLMQEYCPGEMTKAQRDEWAAHQVSMTPTGENAKHVEVLRGILDEYVTEEQRYGWTLERDALQAAMRALSATDNAECPHGVDDGACKECAIDNAEADDLDSFIAKQPQHIQEAINRRYRELSADNAEAVCPNCDRLTEIRHCQACGCDFANLAPPRIEPITCQTFRHDVGKVDFNPCGECNTEPVKEISLSRVNISDEDLALCAVAANRLDDVYHDGIYAAAIRRLVQAVKGEG